MTAPEPSSTSSEVDVTASRPSLTARFGAHLDRLGGMLLSPRRTLRRLIDGHAGGIGEVFLWLIVLLAAVSPTRTGRAILIGRVAVLDGLLVFLTYIRPRLLPLLAGVAAAAALAALVGRRRLGFGRALDVAAYLLVPTLLLMAVGLLLRSLGIELWFLPHRTPRGSLLFQAIHVAVSYGWSLGLLALLLHELRRPVTPPLVEAPNPVAVATKVDSVAVAAQVDPEN